MGDEDASRFFVSKVVVVALLLVLLLFIEEMEGRKLVLVAREWFFIARK
jgi:hypothetical protein